jgi:hypothetical protein
VARRSVVKRVVDLQEESGNTSKTGKARETSDLGGSARDGGLAGDIGLLGGRRHGAGGVGNTRNLRDGGVLVGRVGRAVMGVSFRFTWLGPLEGEAFEGVLTSRGRRRRWWGSRAW